MAVAAVVPGSRDPAELVAAGTAAAQHQAGGPSGRALPPPPPRAYLRTPSLTPGVGASPLVTWGDIAATPLRLAEGGLGGGGDDDGAELAALGIDPLAAAAGPQFKLPDVRRREAAASAAFEKQKKKAAARRGGSATPGGAGAAGLAAASPTPLLNSLRRAAPGTPLSSAAQKLAAQLGKGPVQAGGGSSGGGGKGGGSSTGLLTDAGVHQHLRASYGSATPLAGRTPLPSGAAAGAATPRGRWSLTQIAGGGKSGGGGSAKRGAATAAAAAAAAMATPPNITDGLLQLPPASASKQRP